MRKLKNIITGKFGAAMLSLPLVLTACTDTWNDHYASDAADGAGTQSLLECISQDDNLSDFLALCKVTHLYNNMRITPVTYADLLASDQSLTVWAPVNGSFDAQALIATATSGPQGDSIVAQHFVTNHIARNIYNMNYRTDALVKMLNDKNVPLSPEALSTSRVDADRYNLPATNGLLHVISDDVPYTYNIYEGLTSLPEYSHIGSFLKHFEQQKLNEYASVQSGIVDGKKVYSDSVMYVDNALFRRIDNIIGEDSTFMMLVPDADTWRQVYDEASAYFDYGSIAKADSVGEYWKNVSLIQDLIFNTNPAVNSSPFDSIHSTSYSVREWPYHVFYKPNEADSLFGRAQIKDTLQCTNGVICNIAKWPFDLTDIYFHPVKTEAEFSACLVDSKDCTYNVRNTDNKSISGGSYLDIVPKTSTSNWKATFEVRNTLSGTYDICIVTLPKTVFNATSKDKKPNKFVAKLYYTDAEGNVQLENYDTEMVNTGTNIDTVRIGTFHFPVCNYGQTDATVRLEIDCSQTQRQTQYSREMYLDCIYFRPVVTPKEDAAEARKRKETDK